jgi:hypothetical protein
VPPGEDGLDPAFRVGLDPAAGGHADLHAGDLRADGRDRIADVGGVERLHAVGVAGVDVHGRHALLADGAGVAGEVSRDDRQRGVRVFGARPVQHRLQHRGTPISTTISCERAARGLSNGRAFRGIADPIVRAYDSTCRLRLGH